MRVYEQNLLSGETMRLGGGKYFQIIEAAETLNIQFYKAAGVPSDRADNVGVSYASIRNDEDRFSGVSIYSSIAQKVKIALSEHEGRYNIIAGNVNAVTTPYNKTLKNNQFFGGGSATSAAGTFSSFLIFNKIGSGKVTNINFIKAYSNDFNIILSKYTDSTLIGYLPGDFFGIAGKNKKNDSSILSASKIYVSNVSTLPITSDTIAKIKSNSSVILKMNDAPIEISEGSGLLISEITAGESLSCYMEWEDV